MNDQLKKYYRSIRRNLPCSVKLRRQIMERIDQDIAAYLEGNSEADMEAVQQHFGTPRQIADACIEEMTGAEILQKIKIKRAVIAIVSIATALVLVMWGVTLGAAWMDNHKSENGYAEIIITER